MTYQPPVGYYGSGGNVPGVRPTYVTVLAVIGIVLASLGILVGLAGVIWPLVSGTFAGMSRNPDMKSAMTLSTGEIVVTVLQGAIGLLLAIFLLMSCISALKMKPGFAKAMITWAWLYIAATVLGVILGIVVVAPPAVERALAQQQRMSSNVPANVRQGQEIGAKVGAYGGPVCGAIVGFIYPIFVLIFMRRPLPEYAPMTGYAPQPGTAGFGAPSGVAFPPQGSPDPDPSRQWQQQDPNDPPTPPSNQQWPPNA